MLRRLFIFACTGFVAVSTAQANQTGTAQVRVAQTGAIQIGTTQTRTAQTQSQPQPQLQADSAVRARIPTLPLRVVGRYPHAADAFTEGLVMDGGAVLESTGLENQSSLRRAALKTGVVLKKVRPPSIVFAEGLTVLGKVAYQLTWRDGVVYLYDAATLSSVGQLSYAGEGWGLTTDGRQLIMSDGSSALTWRDPRTFEARRVLKVTASGQPVTNINELEYVPVAGGKGGFIYANIWLTNQIARIDPQTGKVTAWLDVAPLAREAAEATQKQGRAADFDDVANGIAYNPARGTLLLTGKRWPTLFEVSIGK